MTGKFPATFAKYPAGHGFGSRVTVTELLKKAGYETGHFGKWHLGAEQTPGTYGIGEIQGAEATGRKGTGPAGRDAPIYDSAIQFIEKHRDQPFYVQVWGHVSHFPVNPPAEYVARFQDVRVKESDFGPAMREKFAEVRRLGGDVDAAMRNYLADVASLDDAVGRLLQRLDELGLRDKTLVVFSSDHGPAPMRITDRKTEAADASENAVKRRREFGVNMLGSAGPFRGGKHTQLEGGVRAPFILRWPSHIPAGVVDTRSVISGIDWLPTLCGLTGQPLPHEDFDGEDTRNAWLGKAPHVRTKPLLWKTSTANAAVAIRSGPWKLHVPSRRRGEPELYDVVADPAESKNLADQHPEVVSKLRAQADAWNSRLPKEYDKSGAKED
jgi:N-acetylgalactosamine-6-sulfatase